MAVDAAGATVNVGDLALLAGVVQRIETVEGEDYLLITTADGLHSMRVKSEEIRRIAGIPTTVGGGVTDHGELTGLADDDHTQYARADGTRPFTAAQSQAVNPTSPAHLATKDYVDTQDTALAIYAASNFQPLNSTLSSISSGGGVNTGQLIDNGVTDAKLRDSAALSVVGRSANSTGDPADIAAGTDGHVLRRSGTTLGFGTLGSSSIANDAITNALLRNSAALSVIGRSVNSAGDPADIAASVGSGSVLRESGGAIGFGTISTAGIANNSVTLAKLATMATASLLGRNTAGTGNVEVLSAATALTLLGLAAMIAADSEKGEILYFDGSAWTRLAPGSDGQVLTMDGGLPVWA